GLGLSIVERISRVLGHRIVLRSTLGKGSMFALELPFAAPMPAEGRAASVALPASQPLGGLCVLVIDNEAAITEGMQALLGGWGCEVIKAADLDEAEGLLRAAPRLPDGILADYHLDRGDGIEAIVALRWK